MKKESNGTVILLPVCDSDVKGLSIYTNGKTQILCHPHDINGSIIFGNNPTKKIVGKRKGLAIYLDYIKISKCWFVQFCIGTWEFE